MALTSVTVTTNTDVQGRALARNGAVTLDYNTFTTPNCDTTPTTPTTTPIRDGTAPGSVGSWVERVRLRLQTC